MSASASAPLHVLVIDDDVVDARAAERALCRLSWTVHVESAATEAEALAKVRRTAFDLVLLDMQLGPARGEDVVGALREAGCRAGVVLLTGTSDPERVAAGMRAGALDYLPKSSLDAERLDEVVRVAMRVVEAERDLERSRALAQRRSRQLARLVEVSIEVATKSELSGIAEAVRRAGRDIFGAGIEIRLERGGRPLVEVQGDALGTGARHEVELVSAIAAVHGLVAIARDEPLDADERLIAVQLGRICVGGADKLLLLDEARESARERQEIVAIVSHDLRTPLQSFSLGIDTIAMRLEDSPARATLEPTLGRMRRSVGAMARLLTDLLDVSRIHDQAMPLRTTSVEARTIVEDTIEQHLPLAQQKGLALSAEIEGRVQLRCDPARVSQALGNLISNALRYTDHGSIVVRARQRGTRACFEVVDTGPGIPDGVRARLFDRLFQAEPSAKRSGGLGLGLFIVKGIADAHGGHVALDSELGRGSTFRLELPLAGPPEAREGTQATFERRG